MQLVRFTPFWVLMPPVLEVSGLGRSFDGSWVSVSGLSVLVSVSDHQGLRFLKNNDNNKLQFL